MRLLVQSVEKAEVFIHDTGEKNNIQQWLLVYFGVHRDDVVDRKYISQIQKIVEKIAHMRWLKNTEGRLDATLSDIWWSVMVISNFTLYANNDKGNKMSFSHSAAASDAEPVYDYFVAQLKNTWLHVQTGKFAALMEVSATTFGPINYIWDL